MASAGLPDLDFGSFDIALQFDVPPLRPLEEDARSESAASEAPSGTTLNDQGDQNSGLWNEDGGDPKIVGSVVEGGKPARAGIQLTDAADPFWKDSPSITESDVLRTIGRAPPQPIPSLFQTFSQSVQAVALSADYTPNIFQDVDTLPRYTPDRPRQQPPTFRDSRPQPSAQNLGQEEQRNISRTDRPPSRGVEVKGGIPSPQSTLSGSKEQESIAPHVQASQGASGFNAPRVPTNNIVDQPRSLTTFVDSKQPSAAAPSDDRPTRSPRGQEMRRGSGTSPGRGGLRDPSKSRNNTGLSNGFAEEQCEGCEGYGQGRFYCNVCQLIFCGPCWDAQIVHKKNRRVAGSIPHEKTDNFTAQKVKEVLTPNLTDDDRHKLHTQDISTTWFGVHREENELPLFRDYGRYASLISGIKDLRLELTSTVSSASGLSDTLFPSLVSFVGQTGAGKSTLIKLLIDLASGDGESFPTPVTGAAGRDVATSEDVHLYLDPDSSVSPNSHSPLLFADCEGLEGGEREPFGAKLKKHLEKQLRQDAAAGSRQRQLLKYTSERELIWANSPRKQSREFAVAHLYPRLLYTFSDVIVFVLKNPRVIESVLERLIDWAQAALEKSSNQPVLPHAIIAFNASENDIPEELWDVEQATTSLMESLGRTVFHNATFKKYAQFWRERDRQIESVQQLVLSYYSSIRVVRIPTIGRPNLIRTQMEKLSDMIRHASEAAMLQKAELRMLLNADDFQPYLQVAFDHFAENLDTPFDFVQASFSNSPIPNDFGGNILKLAIQVMDCWRDIAKASTIFEELSFLVASCIMLNAARNRIKGKPETIFPMYIEHLDNALENFCDRHWPCEYVGPRGGRCINVRSGHGAKGHQLRTGKLLAAGDYESSFTFAEYCTTFQANTYYKLITLNEMVQDRVRDAGISEEEAAAEIHKEHVLPFFFEHASRGDPKAFISHTVCYSCLFEPPEHPLPCGHIICTPCLRGYGKKRLNRFYEIPECPMERRESRFRNPWKISLKPSNCGVRVLTLDGGGVRGIVELEILKQVEKELGGGINVQTFFDLIVGTSTGGIIALGLTARNWTLEQCTEHFEAFCEKAFTFRKGMQIPGLSWVVENYNHSKYETQPLQDALINAFSDEQYLFGGPREDGSSIDVKVAVTATSAAGTGVVLSNYNRLCLEKLPYQFQRPEKLQGELKTWEAARATSAAPTYFKPLCHEPSKQTYSDGGIYHNNPIKIADQERRLIWPHEQADEPDIIVSIGTAFSTLKKDKTSRFRKSPKGIVAHGQYLSKMAADHLHSSLDTENTWREYMNVRSPSPENKGRYVRINPDFKQPLPKLNAVGQMQELKMFARHQYSEDPAIKVLAKRLVSTCFYFDPVGDVREQISGNAEMYEVAGYFHCRFMPGFEIVELGKFIKRNAVAGHDPHFLIREEGNKEDLAQEVRLDAQILNRMIHGQIFRVDKAVEIRRATKFARTAISLCFTRDTSYPISGFPRQLHVDRPLLPNTSNRHYLATKNSLRWASRSSNSQQRRRKDWKPPQRAASTKREIFERYTDTSHLLGDATSSDELMQIAASTHDLTDLLPSSLRPAKSSNSVSLGWPSPSPHSETSTPFAELSATAAVNVVPPVELPTTELLQDRYLVARDDWTPHENASIYLSLQKGDLVRITKMLDQGWWYGSLPAAHAGGWMPSSWLLPAGPNAQQHFEQRAREIRSIPIEMDVPMDAAHRTMLARQRSGRSR